MSSKCRQKHPQIKIRGKISSEVSSDEDFLADMQGSFKHKFAKKPEVIEGNMNGHISMENYNEGRPIVLAGFSLVGFVAVFSASSNTDAT